MIYPRKEHATVFLDGFVYAIGGYDGNAKKMLSTCERYDLMKDEWELIDSLKKQKCAFAATAVNNRYIYVFGGFDGRERLNTVERYCKEDNSWSLLSFKFKFGFSNASAIHYQDNQILIVGGGTNLGFSYDLIIFDTNLQKVTPISKMSDGRDLRNKLVCVSSCLYACGGNNNLCEKYSIAENEWTTLKYNI